MFYVGQKVVCVHDGAPPDLPNAHFYGWQPSEQIYEGRVYTVTRCHTHYGNDVVWLAEVQRDDVARFEHGPDVGYGAWRFRPITDISVFTRILDAANVKVPA